MNKNSPENSLFTLFENGDADVSNLVNYVDSFFNSNSPNFNSFQLPPIQRNAIWNVAQIERLWDSVLRGYPIGSFLISYRNKFDKGRDFQTGNQMPSDSPGFFILDGQQRTRALLLGFQPSRNARLWIDLDPELAFDNIEYNDRKFLFRVLTNYQPWGMNDKNPSDKLPQYEKMEARKHIEGNLHYDYEVKLNLNAFIENNRKHSWPLRANLPIPFDALINLCGGTSGTFKMPNWEVVRNLIPNLEDSDFPSPPEHYYQLLDAISSLVSTNSDNTKPRKVVFLLQNGQPAPLRENTQDNIEVLFRRINSGGTVLQGEEMAYSLLKSSWDGAYDMVSKIVQNKNVGYLFSSTGIVLAATRLTRFIIEKNDVPRPTIADYRKWIGIKNEENEFLITMQSLLNIDRNEQCRFLNVMEAFCNLVLYRENEPGDMGLPKKFLLLVKPVIIHPVLIWVYKCNCDKNTLEANRTNVLRYLMLCFITVDNHDKASKLAMEEIKMDKKAFPDLNIYYKLLENQLTVHLPTPEQFAEPFKSKTEGLFRDSFNIEWDLYNDFREWFWWNRNTLLWFQREYLDKWFKGYDPTSEDNYDTPYDWDHILPYSHLFGNGNYNFETVNNEEVKQIWKNRNRYINSIGNLRLWPYWANRGDNNMCHTHKLRMNEEAWETDDTAKKLGLCTTLEFLQASSISQEHEIYWKGSGGNAKNWPLRRRLAWQNAVEMRVIQLYITLYNELSFSVYK